MNYRCFILRYLPSSEDGNTKRRKAKEGVTFLLLLFTKFNVYLINFVANELKLKVQFGDCFVKRKGNGNIDNRKENGNIENGNNTCEYLLFLKYPGYAGAAYPGWPHRQCVGLAF